MWPGRCGHQDGREEWCGLRDLWVVAIESQKQGSVSGGGGWGGKTLGLVTWT